jgi:acyl-CoA synthetase (AMP-forming)/AMP-acid ligase II
VWRARKRAEAICRDFGSHETVPNDTSVILFTSGSEAAPKGVPLSHHNLLSNIGGCLDAVSPGTDDVLYGFLPPFHSFGFTVTTLLPLTSGFKVAYYPNPTDARALARGISMWEPTMVCGTPTFISGIFRSASDTQLSSLRRVMTAGEKTPPELVETARKRFAADLLEGYGITECSPVLTLCRPGQDPVGVGPAIKDVELRVVHPDTRQSVATGEQGLIVAAGPNVFAGYLDSDSSNAFMTIDDKRYYITGDLGILDSTGALALTGRLKRFVKIGGEMISLPAMEAVIQQKLSDQDEEATAALTYIEEAGERPIICLFTSTDADVETINGHLRDAGLSNLTRIRKVIQIDDMPLLGTGKTNYRELTLRLKATVS